MMQSIALQGSQVRATGQKTYLTTAALQHGTIVTTDRTGTGDTDPEWLHGGILRLCHLQASMTAALGCAMMRALQRERRRGKTPPAGSLPAM
jgi:hypothetical protein